MLTVAAWKVTGESSPREVEAGQMVKVSCNTSPSIPASTITWRYLNPMRNAGPLPQPKERRLPGTYGGTITRYTAVVGFVVCVRERERKKIVLKHILNI